MRYTSDEDFDKVNGKKCKKNVDFKALDMDDEDFYKIKSIKWGFHSCWYGWWELCQNLTIANWWIQMMRTLKKLIVKNVDFIAFDMVHEDFDKIIR